MTIKEFLIELAKTKSKIDWNTLSIRGRKKWGRNEPYMDFCPITAVYYCKTGKQLRSFYYDQAAKEMGLSKNTTEIIASAADSYKYKLMRDNLIKAVAGD